MKGLILAAGRGTRLRPLTHTRPKPVIRVAGRPIIHYAIENLRAVGIREIGVVVSLDTRKDIQHTLDEFDDLDITYLVQEEPQGLAHAVMVARKWLADDAFLMYLGDNLFHEGLAAFIRHFEALHPAAVIALTPVESPGQFGVAEMENGRVVRLVEKPSEPKSNLAVAGVYVFSPEVHAVIDTLRPSARGEFEITDAVQGLVDRGCVVQGLVVDGWWKDTGRPADLLDANRLLLEDLEPRVEGLVSGSSLTGRVVVERGATVLDSTIVGPALIATGAVVESAYVGPFTSIEAGAQLRRAEVEFSILDQKAVVENVSLRLQQCILGVGAKVTSRAGLPKAHRFMLGDLSTVELG